MSLLALSIGGGSDLAFLPRFFGSTSSGEAARLVFLFLVATIVCFDTDQLLYSTKEAVELTL